MSYLIQCILPHQFILSILMIESTKGEANKLGLWTSTSLVVGNMIGSGVFLMPAALAAFGGISLLGWVFSAIGTFLLARVFSNLSKLLPAINGGPYAYAHEGFGDFTGFLVAWGYWISVWCANAAITVSLVSAMSTFFPVLGMNPFIAILTGLAAIWFLSWINTLGIVTSGKLQLATTLLKIIPLLLISAFGIFYFQTAHFEPFNTSGQSDLSAINATATYTFFAFLGFECATIPSCSVANPDKTIPRATILGTLIATFIYIFSSISILGMIPAGLLQNSLTPFADAAVILWGEAAKYWVSAGIAIAAFGALNGWILIQGQLPHAVAQDKLFPVIFAKENKKCVPAAGILISSIFVSVLMSMNYTKGLVEQYKFLILLSTLTVLIAYLFSSAAYLLVLIKSQSQKFHIKWVSSILLAIGAFAFSLWIIAGAGKDTVYWGFIMLMTGIPLYVLMIFRRVSETNK